ncbi:MAG: ABC transporter permease [Desulfuromonadaceae bacterium]|nr:ABC transporter permease [Desulfuromonadaceae bacterium]MDD2856612.1 ABC transporter permease [Desulfuromonadaceae bacterium]
MISFNLSRRFVRVWQRNFRVYRKTWMISFAPPLLEPLFYLAAFGVGLGGVIGSLSYGGKATNYTAYIAPALIAINIMQSSFFETTFGSFVRMYYQKTFDAMLATPLTIEEIITGEILWGATKSVIGTSLMMVILTFFGLLNFPHSLLLLPIAFLGGFAFSCAGMVCTSVVPTIETLNLPIFLFITPMFLFSGTFFPLDNLPLWAQNVAKFLPLTHLVELCRASALGRLSFYNSISIGYLVIWSAILFPIGVTGMRRRLVR